MKYLQAVDVVEKNKKDWQTGGVYTLCCSFSEGAIGREQNASSLTAPTSYMFAAWMYACGRRKGAGVGEEKMGEGTDVRDSETETHL